MKWKYVCSLCVMFLLVFSFACLSTSQSVEQPTQTPAVTVLVVTATEAVEPEPTLPPTAAQQGASPAETALPDDAELQEAWVREVVDGDTIKVEMEGEIYSLRYIGVDTPELQEGEWMGEEAYHFNQDLVGGQAVVLEKDVSDTDRYGRLLRYVYLPEGTFVNALLVEKGYAEAKAYPPDTKYQDLLEEKERAARQKGLGMWAGSPTPAGGQLPEEGEAGVAITYVDKRAEFVEIKNTGPETISLSGWMLRSERGTQDCGLDGSLAPGETLRIWARAEDQDHGGYNCGFDSNIWNNSESDPALLYDASSRLVDRYP